MVARLNVGGVAVHIAQLTAGLDSQRFAQLVVTGVEGKGEASMLPAVRAQGVQPVVIPELGREIRPRDDAVALAKLTYLFRRWRPDVVETHTAKAGALGRVAAVAAGVKVRVHVFHGHVFEGFFGPRETRTYLEIERRLAGVTTRIIALSGEQREELLAYGVGRPEQVVVVPLGLDLGPYLDVSALRGRLRAELGLAGGDAPGGDRQPAGADEGARGLPGRGRRRCCGAVPGAHFVVAGDGEPERRAMLEEMAAQPPLAGRVHFLGWRSREALREVYADLDLLTTTSDAEGTPVVIIEGMTARLPVVATNVGGVRSLVRDGVTGRLVPPRDALAWADACVELLRDPVRRGVMGRRRARRRTPGTTSPPCWGR